MAHVQHLDNALTTYKHSHFNYGEFGGTVEEITNEKLASIFNFEIKREQSYRLNGEEIPSQYHLVRYTKNDENDTGVVVGQIGVGEQFSILQPSTYIDFLMNDVIPQIPDSKIVSAGTLGNGATSFLDIKIGDSFKVDGDVSDQEQHLVILDPITAGRLKVNTHMLRIVCMNTLKMASLQNNVASLHKEGDILNTHKKITHTESIDIRVNGLFDAIAENLSNYQKNKEFIQNLGKIKLTSNMVKNILGKVFPNNRKSATDGAQSKLYTEALNRFESDDSFTEKNAWNLLNSMTYLLEHPQEVGYRKNQNMGDIAFANMYGLQATQKEKMINTFADLLKVA